SSASATGLSSRADISSSILTFFFGRSQLERVSPQRSSRGEGMPHHTTLVGGRRGCGRRSTLRLGSPGFFYFSLSPFRGYPLISNYTNRFRFCVRLLLKIPRTMPTSSCFCRRTLLLISL